MKSEDFCKSMNYFSVIMSGAETFPAHLYHEIQKHTNAMIFDGYGPYKGDMMYRKQGSLIAFEAGEAITYGLYNAQERGTLFIGPGEKVYAGMVIGQTGKAEDIEINVCKKKQLTNTRSSSADEALRLSPPKVLSLEQALEFIDTDELLEITPTSLRIRKKILDPTLRKRSNMNRG